MSENIKINVPSWVQDSVFYQIFPDRFYKSKVHKPHGVFKKWSDKPTYCGFHGGNLWGIVEKLDYIQKLGINAIYLNPIFSSACNHRYHTHDYYQVDPILGGNEAFKALIDEAHKRDIKIILDGVFNHASRGFFQFNHIMECGPESPYVDWFFIHGYPLKAYSRSGKTNYTAWENLPALPKLNFKNKEVREFILDVAKYWLDQGIDGWRLDVPFEIDDNFWPVFRKVVKDTNPEAYIVGEIWVDEIKNKSQKWLKGDMFDAVMNYGLLGACVSFFIGDKLKSKNHIYQDHYTGEVFDALEFTKRLQYLLSLNPIEVSLNQYNLLESHDTSRFLTIANNKTDVLKLAYLFLFCFPGAPSIYYGSEVGVQGKHDPDCRKTVPWGHDDFDKELLKYFKKLSKIRHDSTALRRGSFTPLYSEGKKLAFLREYEGEKVVVLINNEPKQTRFEFKIDGINSQLSCKLTGKKAQISDKTLTSDPITKLSGAIFTID